MAWVTTALRRLAPGKPLRKTGKLNEGWDFEALGLAISVLGVLGIFYLYYKTIRLYLG